MENFNGREIYSSVENSLDDLLATLKVDLSDNQDIKSLQEKAIGNISKNKQDLSDLIKELEKNSDWNTFTIAFYGETNAGKSTTIEALRILLNEKTKVKQREQYKKQAVAFESAMQEKNRIEEEKAQVTEVFKNKERTLQSELTELSKQLGNVEGKIYAEKNKLSDLNYKILMKMVSSNKNLLAALFKKLPEQIEYRDLADSLKGNEDGELIAKMDNVEETLQNEKLRNTEQLQQLETELRGIAESIVNLEKKFGQYADGAIIGLKQDFTRDVSSYEFTVNEQNFKLLDLPGIEGKEGLVKAQIEEAVQKAHAVIYMRKAAKKLQEAGGNDDTSELDKIKKHLSQEQEVYLLYNKPIPSPGKLATLKDSLLTPEEREQLEATSDFLRTELEGAYKGYKVVSAYPAFLALANVYASEENEDMRKFYRNKNSFLKKFTEEEMLRESKLQDFANWMTDSKTGLIGDSQRKIKSANIKKVRHAIEGASSSVHTGFTEWDEQTKVIRKHLNHAIKDIKKQLDNFKLEVATIKRVVISNFRNETRAEIDTKIESDINNKEFEGILKEISEKNIESLQAEYAARLEQQIVELSKDIEKCIKKATNSIQTELDFRKSDMDLDLGKELKNLSISVKKKSYLGETIGLIASLATIPFGGGVVAIAIAVVDALVALGKMAWGFFKRSYRMSKQREARSEYIEKCCAEIDSNFEERNEQLFESLRKQLKKVCATLDEKARAFEITKQKYIETEEKLSKIVTNL